MHDTCVNIRVKVIFLQENDCNAGSPLLCQIFQRKRDRENLNRKTN